MLELWHTRRGHSSAFQARLPYGGPIELFDACFRADSVCKRRGSHQLVGCRVFYVRWPELPDNHRVRKKKRYPNSSIVGSHVYVADRDSRDHIFGIDLPQSDGSCRRMRLFFERRGRTPSYPACDGIAANVTKRYGERTSVQEFTEERSWNRRLIWKREGEQLELTCFRMGQEPLYAADLAITSCK